MPEIARAHYFKTRSPRPKSLAPTIVQNTPSSPKSLPPTIWGEAKLLYYPRPSVHRPKPISPKGRGRTVTPPHISDKCVCKTWFHSPPNSPHSYLVGAKSPSPRKLPSPEPRNLSPSSMAPHRTNFTAALLPNAGDAVQLPLCTGPCASYSVLLVLPRRRPREPYRSRFTPAVVHGAGAAPTSDPSRVLALLPRSR